MNASKLLAKYGFNADGSKMSKSQLRKRNKKNVVSKVDLLIAGSKEAKKLFYKRQTQLDASGK